MSAPASPPVASWAAGRGLEATIERLAQEVVERRRRASCRAWSAMMLATTPDVWGSVLRGRPVMVGRLDPEALRRALRGSPLPADSEFIVVTAEMLDAVNEAGPLR